MSNHLAFRQQPLGANYPVQLPAFEGPLDLLLHLIETQALDVSTISLVAVTDQYLRTMGQFEEVQPGALADFLIVASRLLYIKSHHLLPKLRHANEEDEDEASGDALLRQLMEYRRFKEIAWLLHERELHGLRVYLRAASAPEVPRKLEWEGMDASHLYTMLRKVLQRIPIQPPMPRVKTYAITVTDQIETIRSRLRTMSQSKEQLSFEGLLSIAASRLEVIVTFLAILELFKLGEIDIDQAGTFAEIQIAPSKV